MAGADWKQVLVDETGSRHSYISINGVNLSIKKCCVCMEKSGDKLELDDDLFSLDMYLGDLRINYNQILVGQDNEIDGVYLFLRYFDESKKKHSCLLGIGCCGYTDEGEFIGIDNGIVSRYRDWLLEVAEQEMLPENLGQILEAMLTKRRGGGSYGGS